MSREWSESDLLRRFEESYNEDHPDANFKFPTTNEVCWTCGGNGKHVNPAIDGNGITRSEMDELGPDFFEDYMSGVYDVLCTECHGRNVVPVIDEDRVDPVILQEFNRYVQFEYDYRAEIAAERRMGC